MDDHTANLKQQLDTIRAEMAGLRQLLTRAYPALVSQFMQLEAYTALLHYITPRLPLPPTGEAAVAADLALLLANQIAESKPMLTLELGSGLSTLVAGYCLERRGRGQLISLEHDIYYAQQTVSRLAQHGLENYAQVIHAPLTPLTLGGERFSWYNRAFLSRLEPGSISLLFVDGPPGSSQRLARYPALPILLDYLTDKAIIVVDDADREDEKKMVDRWLAQFPGFSITSLKTYKGTVILTRDR